MSNLCQIFTVQKRNFQVEKIKNQKLFLRSKLSCNTRLFVDVNKVIKRGVTAEDTAILFLRSNLQSAVNACATL